ncbi:hypothetical protein TA3x_005049 [Tundrisphaera sp. TA3]|uniref:hypothetical protein n=1 Tax=Tundrisphaera sp. TA3 TaxID=3435775 RepID=UPI003EBBF4DC
MTQPEDASTPPEPASGLADPRMHPPGPEMFGTGDGTGSALPDADVPPGQERPTPEDGTEDAGADARGLIDPRSEIADPASA